MSEMNVEAERAADLAEFAKWKGYPLPALNGDGNFDKDWLHREWVAFRAGRRRAAQPADVGAMRFPELPEPQHELQSVAKTDAYTAEQMFQYASDAIAADRLARDAAYDAATSLAGDTIDARNAEIADLRAQLASDQQAGTQPVAQALPTDEQITEIARVAVGAGELNWAGYKANTDGKYTIPAISPMEFGLCRAVVRALAAPTPATDQDALDAKRYRWLRAQPFDTWKRIGWNTWGDDPAVFPIRDEDIDSAMAATPVTDQAATKQENQQ